MNLLVSIAEVKANTMVTASKASDDIAIRLLIEETQVREIKPMLGEKLYMDLLKNPTLTDSGRNYPKLLEETEYTYDSITYTSAGIKAVMYLLVEAKYRRFGQDFSTPSGIKQARGKSDRPDKGQIREQYRRLYLSAEELWKDVRNYLGRVDGTNDGFTYWYGSDYRLKTDVGAINRVTIM